MENKNLEKPYRSVFDHMYFLVTAPFKKNLIKNLEDYTGNSYTIKRTQEETGTKRNPFSEIFNHMYSLGKLTFSKNLMKDIEDLRNKKN